MVKKLTFDEVDVSIYELQRRVERIEARQRTAEHHDPDCKRWEALQFNARGLAYMKVPPCNCWLSE